MISYNTSIAIVEDNDDLAYAYRVLIENVQDYHLSGVYSSGEDFIKEFKRRLPDVVIVDLGLPGISGIDLIKRIRKINDKSLIMVVSVHEEIDMIFDALNNGAIGYISKDEGPVGVLKGLEQLLNGGAPMSPQIAKKIILSFHRNYEHPFTKREMQILEYLSKGFTTRKIGEILEISGETVKTHYKNIYLKLHVSSRGDAIEKARKYKYIQ